MTPKRHVGAVNRTRQKEQDNCEDGEEVVRTNATRGINSLIRRALSRVARHMAQCFSPREASFVFGPPPLLGDPRWRTALVCLVSECITQYILI